MHHELTAAAVIAAVSQVLVAIFGVDYYAMLWAFVGASFALTQVPKMGRARALVYVALSTLGGAALATAGADFMGANRRPVIIVLALVSGSGAQLIIATLLQGGLNRIKTILGVTNEPAQSSH